MGNGVMKIIDVLKYAVRIENESQLFYKKAKDTILQEETKKLLEFLLQEEVEHGNRLQKKINSLINSDTTVNIDKADFYILVENSPIDKSMSKEDIFKVALEREIATRNLYSKISSITNLDADIIDIFTELYTQESGHVKKVEQWIENLL